MSNIIYAPKSWNPIEGCTPISEGCKNCWAKVMARRQRQEWGTVHLHPERLDQPLRWRKPQTVAVAFMGDLFHDQVPDSFLNTVFSVMGVCGLQRKRCMRRDCDHDGDCVEKNLHPQPLHTFLVLTKRPDRMREFLSDPERQYKVQQAFHNSGWYWGDLLDDLIWPLPNVWLGVSCENQARADERIPLLLETPAAHRWLSLEPLLGPIRFPLPCKESTFWGGISWCVVGGESGPYARPCDLDWIRNIRDQSKAAGVPCYVKQVGAKPMLPNTMDGNREWIEGMQAGLWEPIDGESWRRGPNGERLGYAIRLRDRKGENPDEWPLDLRVREMPEELAHGPNE